MNLLEQLNLIRTSLGEIEYKLAGWEGISSRPARSAFNSTAYNFWFNKLTETEKQAEQALKRNGYYNYEGVETMFSVKDSKNIQIHTDDEVEWQEKKCIVVCILSEQEIQINPLGEGLPELVHPSTVTVINSFIEKLRKLTSNEELQKILKSAELRMEAEMATRKPARLSKVEGAPKAAKINLSVEAEEL